ncbi:hypothetical protein [Alteromonas sp. KUL49]|uniref:hypothetical protein n=1 Tax=Alteromonas sp. KUL49 TaxID=2480798 RepID=UPI00102F117D|nr:hypothetical protein [Alteromonas sp. KUL49]TAP40920.1 hypothetical protein EYS00_07380 [Alteromonas sp. KUL49]GEA11101.1 DNA repair ATPase [Alteromonas sp. KUL49]
MYEAIIISIVVLLIAAIFINALQQHKAKVDAERRAEAAKQRTIIDETENVIMACSNMPISPRLMDILHTRVVNALRIYDELNGSAETKQRVADAEQRTSSGSDKEKLTDFVLPSNDKLIIQYIQAVKKLRVLLRSEHSRGKVDSKVYAEEDRQLERLQIKVNVETLIKRGKGALQTNMLGSARQYFEKAKSALENQTQHDDYTKNRISSLNEWLEEIQSNLKSVNAQDRAKKHEEERDELDELFAPKKKW